MERAAEAMQAETGRLVTGDVRRLAGAVADQVVAAHGVTGEKAERVKSRVRDLVYRLALGVTRSALYSLLAYLANMITISFYSAEAAATPSRVRRGTSCSKRSGRAIAPNSRRVLEPMPQLVGLAVYQEVSKHEQFRAAHR